MLLIPNVLYFATHRFVRQMEQQRRKRFEAFTAWIINAQRCRTQHWSRLSNRNRVQKAFLSDVSLALRHCTEYVFRSQRI